MSPISILFLIHEKLTWTKNWQHIDIVCRLVDLAVVTPVVLAVVVTLAVLAVVVDLVVLAVVVVLVVLGKVAGSV